MGFFPQPGFAGFCVVRWRSLAWGVANPAHASDERNRKDRAVSGLGGCGSLPILHAVTDATLAVACSYLTCVYLRPALVFDPSPQLLLYGFHRRREPAGPVSVVVHLHEGDDP